MALYLTEQDVERLLPMQGCLEAVEQAFRQWAEGRADNRPRARAVARGAVLHALAAASEDWGRLAAKVYATTRQGARFVVLLFDGRSSELLAVIEADRLGQTRTGAASGVATRHLARGDARSLAIIGTGWQARAQARAIALVRRLDRIGAFGRDRERLRAFCRETEAACGVRVTACGSAEEAVRGADIVVTATSSMQPVVRGDWLAPGVHLNAIGGNRAERRELDDAAIARAGLIVVDSIEQARLEAGDLLPRGAGDATGAGAAPSGGAAGDPKVAAPSVGAAPSGTAAGASARPLDRAVELKDVIGGAHPGRRDASEITLFKSLGIGLEDLAAASLVYDRAIQGGVGRTLPPGGPGAV